MGGSMSPLKAGWLYRHFEGRFLRSPSSWRKYGLRAVGLHPPAHLSQTVPQI